MSCDCGHAVERLEDYIRDVVTSAFIGLVAFGWIIHSFPGLVLAALLVGVSVFWTFFYLLDGEWLYGALFLVWGAFIFYDTCYGVA